MKSMEAFQLSQTNTCYFGTDVTTKPLPQPVIAQRSQPNTRPKQALFEMAMSFRANSISIMYQAASEKSGGYVKIDQKFGCLPILWGKDNQPVAVYEVVEEIEAILDFGKLRSRFPTLSYTQVTATVGFIRSLTQFNSKNIDIDALQDEEFENTASFQEVVRQAIDDKEAVRVLATL